MQEYTLHTTCVTAQPDDLDAMLESGRQIKRASFMARVSARELQRFFPQYRWYGIPDSSLNMMHDYHVTYWSGMWRGKRCYYLIHSAIEYIFTKERRNADDIQGTA